MPITVLIAIAILALAAGLFIFHAIPAVRAFFDYRGKRPCYVP